MYGGRRYAKIALFRSTEKSVNYQDILDCHVSSGQATGIKIVYLTSFKNGDYADIDIIPQKLVFWKTENFLPNFVRLKCLPAQWLLDYSPVYIAPQSIFYVPYCLVSYVTYHFYRILQKKYP